MDEEVYCLHRDGCIETLSKESTNDFQQIDGETDPKLLAAFNAQSIAVKFNSIADGRGFSLVKSIRQDSAFNGKLYASGDLNPDQLSFAFQVGFDAVLVSTARWQQYGEDSWRSAMTPIVNLSYSQTHSEPLQSIWQHRHST